MTTTNSTAERVHAMDAVRAFALLCGVALHASMSFIPGLKIWAVDVHPSASIAGMFYVIHAFRMTTFFVIAGFFGRMLLHKRGVKGFVSNRLKRIGLPLVAGWLILAPATIGAIIWGAIVMNHGVMPKAPVAAHPAAPWAGGFPLTHLWFLYVLVLLYVLALAVRGLVVLVDRKGVLRRLLDRPVAAVLGGQAYVLVCAPLAVAFYLSPAWTMWSGVPTPDHNLVPGPVAMVAFGSAFGVGWLLHRQPQLLRVFERRWLLNLALAAVVLAGSLFLGATRFDAAIAAHGSMRALGAGLYALAVWTSSVAVIGLGYRFLSGHHPAVRYLADASYWVYLIHLPIVIVLQILAAPIDLPAWIKLLGIVGIAMALMLASYEYLVRYSFIGAVLNGRRKRPAKLPSLPRPTDRELALRQLAGDA